MEEVFKDNPVLSWEYIRKHGLEDPKKKTNINADDKLLPVLGGRKQVTMFELTKFVNQHLLQSC